MSSAQPQATNSSTLPITRPCFDDQEVEAVRKVLDSGWVTQGPTTSEFERAFARRHQVKHALATTSCTAALHMAVLALDIGPGDEVIVPAFTWVTSAHCAELVRRGSTAYSRVPRLMPVSRWWKKIGCVSRAFEPHSRTHDVSSISR